MQIELAMTVPKNFLDDKKIYEGIVSALEEKSAPHLKKDFKMTTQTWLEENKPFFSKRLTRNVHSIYLDVFARKDKQGKLYRLVSRGSPKHKIPLQPKVGGFLRFKRGYHPLTTPGKLMSNARRGYEGLTEYAKQVNHPGFEPRNFDITVADEYAPYFEKDVQTGIDMAVKEIMRNMSYDDIRAGYNFLTK